MIILSIPFNNNFYKIFNKYKDIPHFKEFRLDYSSNLEKFPLDILDKKSIVTIRDKNLGGVYDINKSVKYEFYKDVLKKTKTFIDIEYENRKVFADLISKKTIISYHNFGIFDKKKINEVVNTSQKNIFCLKIAVNISNYSELNFLFNLSRKSNKKIIFVGMGKLGKLSRLLYPFYSYGTFVGLSDNKTADGQIDFEELKKFSLNKIDSDFLIGGLIGGQQVYRSLGIKFYNDYFNKHKIKAVYLPFEVENFEDFQQFIANNFENKWFGFSVTMPHKINAAKNSELKSVNLLSPNNSYNTDEIALKKSIKYLKLNKNDNILIIGTGGIAKVAFELLKNFTNVAVSGRNIKLKEISPNFKKLTLNEIQNYKFDCIINCTPIGMNGENFYQYFHLKKASKMIDLPYSENEINLTEFYISGKQFWKWQSEKQLEIFLENIKQLSSQKSDFSR